MSEWRTIDSAPKDGERIDVWFRLSDSHGARWVNVHWMPRRERWANGPTDQGVLHWFATHWMPIEPPSTPTPLTEEQFDGLNKRAT